jgi:Transposase DDE domain
VLRRKGSTGIGSSACVSFEEFRTNCFINFIAAIRLPLAEQAALAQVIAVDGSLLPALPRMAWALWQDDQHRAAKMPVAFAVLRQGPIAVTVTAGNGSERAAWRRLVQPGGFSVVDRGSVDYRGLQELHDLPCSFRCRVKDNAAYEVQEERALAAAAVHAGVVRDVVRRRLGTAHHTRLLPQPFRLVQVATGTTRKDGTPEVVVLVTNRLDLDAELLVIAYRSRWAVELFFRWVQWVLGCRHLLSQGINGVRLQVYAALIASLLISLGVGHAPTKRTYEMRCFYLSGWATEAAVIAPIDRLHLQAPPPCKK